MQGCRRKGSPIRFMAQAPAHLFQFAHARVIGYANLSDRRTMVSVIVATGSSWTGPAQRRDKDGHLDRALGGMPGRVHHLNPRVPPLHNRTAEQAAERADVVGQIRPAGRCGAAGDTSTWARTDCGWSMRSAGWTARTAGGAPKSCRVHDPAPAIAAPSR